MKRAKPKTLGDGQVPYKRVDRRTLKGSPGNPLNSSIIGVSNHPNKIYPNNKTNSVRCRNLTLH